MGMMFGRLQHRRGIATRSGCYAHSIFPAFRIASAVIFGL
jgi:hypothetical protein